MENGFKIGHLNDHLIKGVNEDSTSEYKIWYVILNKYLTFFSKKNYVYSHFYRHFDINDVDGDLELEFPSSIIMFNKYKNLGVFDALPFTDSLDQVVLDVLYNALSRLKYEYVHIKSIYFTYNPSEKLSLKTLNILKQISFDEKGICFIYIDKQLHMHIIDFSKEISMSNDRAIKAVKLMKKNHHISFNKLAYGLDTPEGQIMRSLSGEGEEPEIYGF